MARKRYAIVGVGSRASMFLKALTETHRETSELVAICDDNPGRLEYANQVRLPAHDHAPVPAYAHADFDRMLSEQKVDSVIVTTRDCFHHEYICRAMEAGCDAITEKPMTTDPAKTRQIIETARKTGRNCRVTFNYRYAPPRSQVKQLLMDGAIGRVLSVDFQWLLDRRHGADYFRRWHRNKANSGGLLVHKSTHHFDLVNWWISSRPQRVVALGDRKFYTPQTALELGLEGHGERCAECAVSDQCRFFIDIQANEGLRKLYRDHEHHDGYYRDRCVFSDEIDIEDNMQVAVNYHNGVSLAYSLVAYSPVEGYQVTFTGTDGRLTHSTLETSYVSGENDAQVHETIKQSTKTFVQKADGPIEELEVTFGSGGHGGGDTPLLDGLFAAVPPADPLHRDADYVEGAWSIIAGMAANASIARGGEPIDVEKLLGVELEEPNFTPMPVA